MRRASRATGILDQTFSSVATSKNGYFHPRHEDDAQCLLSVFPRTFPPALYLSQENFRITLYRRGPMACVGKKALWELWDNTAFVDHSGAALEYE